MRYAVVTKVPQENNKEHGEKGTLRSLHNLGLNLGNTIKDT
jgi:hypothetical protein